MQFSLWVDYAIFTKLKLSSSRHFFDILWQRQIIPPSTYIDSEKVSVITVQEHLKVWLLYMLLCSQALLQIEVWGSIIEKLFCIWKNILQEWVVSKKNPHNIAKISIKCN